MKMKENWKPVTISGITGILMGAGSVLAARELTTGKGEAIVEAELGNELKEITVDDSMNFKEAFNMARNEIGPGGVFHWHGKIFNTFTAEEWGSMSNDDKNLFAQRIKPEVSPEDVDIRLIAETEEVLDGNEDITEEVRVVSDEITSDEDVALSSAAEVVDNDDDVRVIGYGDIDLANGNSVTVEELEINGQRVAVIDVDKDGVGDIAMSDINHNNRPDDGEIIDLHTGDVLSFDSNTSDVENIDVDSITSTI